MGYFDNCPKGIMSVQYNIYLIGFMGCGKTTVAGALSEMCKMEAVEMEQAIAEREGMAIPDIFSLHGEAYFREKETELLCELAGRQGLIVSCGGGTPMRECNVAKMKESGKIVLLTARPKTVYERVKDDHSRPLLEGNKTVSYIEGLMEKRRGKYEAAADIVIKTDGKDKGQICEELAKRLREA